MKIKIEYKYRNGDPFPYFATTEIGIRYIVGCSHKSFEAAKEDLLSEIKKQGDAIKVPEPEVVEL